MYAIDLQEKLQKPAVALGAVIDRVQKGGKLPGRDHHLGDLAAGDILEDHAHALAPVIIDEMFDIHAVLGAQIIPLDQVIDLAHGLSLSVAVFHGGTAP